MSKNIHFSHCCMLIDNDYTASLDEYLKENSLDANLHAYKRYGEHLLTYAIKHFASNNILNCLIENGATLNKAICSSHLLDALGVCAYANNLKALKFLLNNNAKDNIYLPVLCVAAQHGSVHMLKYLLKKGFDVNQECIIQKTPLMHAIDSNNVKNVKCLLSCGASINYKRNYSVKGKKYIETPVNKIFSKLKYIDSKYGSKVISSLYHDVYSQIINIARQEVYKLYLDNKPYHKKPIINYILELLGEPESYKLQLLSRLRRGLISSFLLKEIPKIDITIKFINNSIETKLVDDTINHVWSYLDLANDIKLDDYKDLAEEEYKEVLTKTKP